MKWLVEIAVIGCAIFFGVNWVATPICNCQKLPENYFVVETKETEMCVDESRQTIVTKITKSGKVEFN